MAAPQDEVGFGVESSSWGARSARVS